MVGHLVFCAPIIFRVGWLVESVLAASWCRHVGNFSLANLLGVFSNFASFCSRSLCFSFLFSWWIFINFSFLFYIFLFRFALSFSSSLSISSLVSSSSALISDSSEVSFCFFAYRACSRRFSVRSFLFCSISCLCIHNLSRTSYPYFLRSLVSKCCMDLRWGLHDFRHRLTNLPSNDCRLPILASLVGSKSSSPSQTSTAFITSISSSFSSVSDSAISALQCDLSCHEL